VEQCNLNMEARYIIQKAMNRGKSRNYVARFYGIPPTIVQGYLDGLDCGPLRAREVIRVEIARKRAERLGEEKFFPTDKDRYKGTR
jgi:hypothetical protein